MNELAWGGCCFGVNGTPFRWAKIEVFIWANDGRIWMTWNPHQPEQLSITKVQFSNGRMLCRCGNSGRSWTVQFPIRSRHGKCAISIQIQLEINSLYSMRGCFWWERVDGWLVGQLVWKISIMGECESNVQWRDWIMDICLVISLHLEYADRPSFKINEALPRGLIEH